MIVLDTNVISEPLKPQPDPRVMHWLDAQNAETLYLTAPSLAEILSGIEILPAGKRKRALAESAAQVFQWLFAERFLSFDRAAAIASSILGARAAGIGYTIGVIDCQIAAIAAVHGFTVATRDEAPFRAVGVPVVNPWEA